MPEVAPCVAQKQKGGALALPFCFHVRRHHDRHRLKK